ncbi:MAG: hypothetical protein ACYTEZ_00290 [Planctomycetota bacterium]
MRALLVLLFVSVALSAPGRSRPRVVHLKDGSKVIGRIVEKECTEDILVIRDLKTRAKRRVPWDDIKPELAQSLKIQLGFAVSGGNGGGRTIQGHRIKNRAGTVFQGLLVNAKTVERDGFYVLKTADGDRRIRLADVRSGPDPVELDALEVYKPLELYEQELAKKNPETAEDHFRLAEFARVWGALEQAKHHLEKVLELDDPDDAKYQRAKIERLLEVVNKLLGSQQAFAELKGIKKSIVYRKYPRAAEQLTAFREAYKDDQDLLEAADNLETELKEKRSKHYVGMIPSLLRNTIKELLLKKVREKDLTLREAQQYVLPQNERRQFLKSVRGGLKDPSAGVSVSDAAWELIGKKLDIGPEEVKDFWEKRSKRSTHSAFYRDGTFIVVEELEDALARAPKVKPKKGEKAPKLPKPKKRKTPEEWWEGKIARRKFSELRDWLFAWWAEKSGLCEVLEPREEICPTCHGKGYVQHLLTGPEGTIPFFDRCTTCHMAKHWRVVRFK